MFRVFSFGILLSGVLAVFLMSSVSVNYAYADERYASLVLDAESGVILHQENAGKLRYPASLTKMMTLYLVFDALERGKLTMNQKLPVSSRAASQSPSKLGLKQGQKVAVKDLVLGVIIKSANDAAGVLAEAVAGSEKNFVDMMNQKAWNLGARDTHFANPHGLPSRGSQYTTAKDMALIFKEALKDPFFQRAITFKYRILYSKEGRRHFLKSHNKSLFLNWRYDVFGKTGYTQQAQSCFVGYVKRGNETFIVDVFGTRKRWDYLKWLIEHNARINL